MVEASAISSQPVNEPTALVDDLWRHFLESRDPTLRLRLIDQHLQFARMLAAKIYSRRQGLEYPFEDYLHCAIVALIQCVDRYDLEHGAKFKTYAQYRIEGALLNELPKFSEQHAQVDLITRLRKGRIDSLASPEDHNKKRSKKKNDDLFEQMVEVAVGLSIGYMLEDYGMYSDPERVAECEGYSRHAMTEMRGLLHDLVELLPANEKVVVKQHYFFGVGMEEISEHMLLTKGRVSQLHRQGLRNLKKMAEDVGLTLNL